MRFPEEKSDPSTNPGNLQILLETSKARNIQGGAVGKHQRWETGPLPYAVRRPGPKPRSETFWRATGRGASPRDLNMSAFGVRVAERAPGFHLGVHVWRLLSGTGSFAKERGRCKWSSTAVLVLTGLHTCHRANARKSSVLDKKRERLPRFVTNEHPDVPPQIDHSSISRCPIKWPWVKIPHPQ